MDKSKAQMLLSVKGILNSQEFKILDEYMSVRKSELVTRLISCKQEDLEKLQGQIMMLEEITRLPQTLQSLGSKE